MADSKKLVWHKSGQNRFELGVQECALYVKKEPSQITNGAVTEYNNGVAWNGITSIQESPDGAEANDLWADNIKYGTLRSAETFGGTIEAYNYPDEFLPCDGFAQPVTGFLLGQQKRKQFGLAYKTNCGNETQTDSDDGYKLHIVYNCTASPSDRQYETINDSPDAITFSWEFDTIPVQVSPISLGDGSTQEVKPVSTITVNSLDAKTSEQQGYLAVLEEALFGGSNSAYLPTPDVVIGILRGKLKADGTAAGS